MRVVAGKYKGKKIESPSSSNIRPTGDKVKQALFTKLQFFVEDKIVLDLFSGSGSLGIEALSRGAKKVYFCDKDKRSILLTKNNLKGINDDFVIIPKQYNIALDCIKEKIDLILIDPPYNEGLYNDALKIIYDNKILSDDGIIVCEHLNEEEIITDFKCFDKKRYGTVTLSYFEY